MNEHLLRAQLLIQQSRYELAAQELRGELAVNPESPMAHSLLALALASQGKPELYDEAMSEARQGVFRAPDEVFSHYAIGFVFMQKEDLDKAEAAYREAMRLDPEDERAVGMLASLMLMRHRWDEALKFADQGLAIDPESEHCTNVRARALTQLGRRAEAADAITGTLSRNPENAYSHANQGWTLLADGNHAKAVEHFREALRLDPNLEWARAGVIEALKARNLLYRVILNYFLFMSRLSGRAQWAVIIGTYVGYRVVLKAAQTMHGAGFILWPLVILYIVFVYLTWTAKPLSNLALRLHRFGRLALSREEKKASNWTGAAALLAVAGIGGGLLATLHAASAPAGRISILLGVLSMIMVIPIAGTLNLSPGRARRYMTLYTLGLGLVGLLTILGMARDWEGTASMASLFFIGIFAFGIIANILMARD